MIPWNPKRGILGAVDCKINQLRDKKIIKPSPKLRKKFLELNLRNFIQLILRDIGYSLQGIG